MPREVKLSAIKKVAIATETAEPSAADLAWARQGLGFTLGVSTWQDRGNAIAQAYGGKAEAASAAGIPLSTFKSQLARGNPPSNPAEFADQLGLSARYVESGTPVIPADFDIEAVRLKLARGAFAPTGSSQARREALRRAVDAAREEIDARRFSATSGTAFAAPLAGAGLADAGADSLVTPATLAVILGQPGLKVSGSPLSFSREWLLQQRLEPESLGVLELPRIGVFLIDTGPAGKRLVDRCLYAVHSESVFEICQYLRTESGGELTVAPGHPVGITDPHRDPAGVVGRVVYELRPL